MLGSVPLRAEAEVGGRCHPHGRLIGKWIKDRARPTRHNAEPRPEPEESFAGAHCARILERTKGACYVHKPVSDRACDARRALPKVEKKNRKTRAEPYAPR